MDVLADHGTDIETEVFWNTADLFNLEVDLVFHDSTNAWFECGEEDWADEEWNGRVFKAMRRRRYVLCYNEEEATRRRDHRERLIAEFTAELEIMWRELSNKSCGKIASKGFGRCLFETSDGRLYVDEWKVERVPRFNGKFVLQTNNTSISAEDIVKGYKGMWIIEGCFRKVNTSVLAIRPVFYWTMHWTMHRFVTHMRLCMLLTQRVAELKSGMTWMRITDSLEGIKAVKI